MGCWGLVERREGIGWLASRSTIAARLHSNAAELFAPATITESAHPNFALGL